MRLRIAILALLGSLLAACGPQQDDLRDYIQRINARPGQPPPPLPEVQPYEPFAYEAAGRRPPFKPLEPERAAQDSADQLRPDPERPRQTLEAFPLDALKMVGTIDAGGRRFALIRDPDGVIHRLPVGAYAGQNHGRIVAIDDSGAQLIEIVPDGFGGWVERPATLPLAERTAGERS